MNKKPEIDEEDRELFLKHMAGVRPLAQNKISPHSSRTKVKISKKTLTDLPPKKNRQIANLTPKQAEEALYYQAPGVQNTVMRKLMRGTIPIAAELDLHGLNLVQAEAALERFLARAVAHSFYCVRIIHGKGRSSHNERPLLKNKTNEWLQQNEHVVAFCSAKPYQGGTGAVHVLLKRKN